jgi:hypothetical protein
LSENAAPGTPSPSTSARIAGLIAANATLLAGTLVYMGWAYDSAFLGYFHLSPLDLGVGVSEYILRSLNLFSPALVIVAVLTIAVTVGGWGAAGAWAARSSAFPVAEATGKAESPPSPDTLGAPDEPATETPGTRAFMAAFASRTLHFLRALVPATEDARRAAGRLLLIRSGFAITGVALVLAWAASYVTVSTYLVLILLAVGPLLLTWPNRAAAHGRFLYALAVVVAAVCGLWATSLYAQGIGTRDAQTVVRDLPSRTAVALYSTERLGLTGPGLRVQQLPPGAYYHYVYQGLRLLISRSGTYYLLPVGWYPGVDDTYVIDDSDMVQVVLYSGVVRASAPLPSP